MKKKYQKPDMTVYQLNRRPLLCKSADEPASYIPHLDGDMNQMA